MFRYVVFVWNDAEPAVRSAASRLCAEPQPPEGPWRTAFSAAGLEVRCAGERPGRAVARRLRGGRGVVLGELFARNAEGISLAVPARIDAPESYAIVASGGRRLIERYWGRYVAVLRDPASREVRILRDPSAGLPCYTLRIGELDVYCSRIEDVRALRTRPFEPDWAYVTACLCLLREHSAPSGLQGVTQVLGGQCVRHREARVTRSYEWDPLALAAAAPVDEPQAAAEALGRCTRDVVRAWGASFRSVLLSLSGGLDSSILLACLALPPGPRLRCFHYYPPHTDLDERRFARLAAAHAGVELIERERPLGFELAALLAVPASAEPTNYLFYLEHSRREAALARAQGAGALFIGYGGDQLFYAERAEWAPAEFLRRRGLARPLLGVLLDAARMDQLSLWRVLGGMAREVLGRRRWSPLDEAGRARALLAPGVVSAAVREAYCLHPLMHRQSGASSGKRWHAHQVLAPFDFYDPLAVPGDAERIAPLVSQPLIELCLRIPVDVLTAGGWDRAIARRAFGEALPAQIRNRRNKGGIEAHSRLTVERNRPLLRELLLDGELVRCGLLARAALEQALAGRAEIKTQSGELLEYASIEAWLRCWRGPDSSRQPNMWHTVA